METYAQLWIVGVVLTGVVLDIWLATNDTPNHRDTISAVMKTWGASTPSIPYALGVLQGHFFLQLQQIAPFPDNLYLLATVGAWWVLFGVNYRAPEIEDRRFHVWIMCAAMLSGVLAGALLWPQRPI